MKYARPLLDAISPSLRKYGTATFTMEGFATALDLPVTYRVDRTSCIRNVINPALAEINAEWKGGKIVFQDKKDRNGAKDDLVGSLVFAVEREGQPETIYAEPESVSEPIYSLPLSGEVAAQAAGGVDPSITSFTSDIFGTVRVVEKDGEPWFVAADVCKALEINNSRDTLNKRLDEDEKGVALIYTLGGNQELAIVSEPGLYSLVLGSRKPEAKAFKRWITHDVIPSIRKHGAYMTRKTIDDIIADPKAFMKLVTALAEEKEKNDALARENAALSTKALTWDKRSFVNAAIRRLSKAMPSYHTDVRFAQAWSRFKREMLYNHGVNLESRRTALIKGGNHNAKLVDAIPQDCEDTAVQVATALCRENGVDIADLLKSIPA